MKRETRPGKTASELAESPEFKRLVSRRWTVSLSLLALLFVTYYGFILLISYAPELMKSRVGQVTTLAIPLGIAVILIAFVLTAFYVGWANSTHDPEVQRLRGQLKR
jgi:uncharacterized membrane protein (DUF485 family)